MKYLLTLLIVAATFSLQSCNNADASELALDSLADMRVPLADPFIWVEDTTYYAYGTYSQDGIKVYSSTNLIEWYEHTEHALYKDNSYGNKYFWAPDMAYNEVLGKYLLYYAAENHMCVAVGDNPLGPFKQTAKSPLSDLWAVDHTVFNAPDETLLMYYSTNFNSNYEIWVCELTEDGLHIKDGTQRLCIRAEDRWESIIWPVNEGSYVIKHGDYYYMIYSGSGYQSQDYAIGYAVAKNPKGPWKKYDGNPILHRPWYKDMPLYGTGHGSIFTDLDGQLRLVFHAHNSSQAVDPRCMYITSVHFTDDPVPQMYFGDDIIRPICIGVK